MLKVDKGGPKFENLGKQLQLQQNVWLNPMLMNDKPTCEFRVRESE